MNAVEIEEAVSDLVAEPFNTADFPFRFLAAYGNKETTIKKLRSGASPASDVPGGVLQRNNIHVKVSPLGNVQETLKDLRESTKTTSAKAKFILATDGVTIEAEDLVSGDPLACDFTELPNHFAFFLPLAGISTVKEIKNNPIDVKATGRLNRLYVELLKDNPDWGTEAKRPELNQFIARLIFCFFAEDTSIFRQGSFTATITQLSHAGHGTGNTQWGNTHEVLQHLFLAMDTPVTHEGNFDDRHRRAAGVRPWADVFPYVNGGLFTGASECPQFSRTARAYLLRAGELDWKEINPDIFGSMIQAVADDGERGELGMHYTSVPNILKVLNPLLLDELHEQLEAAGDNRRKLQNLRRRLATVRMFDPACGSGNFLVIAYKEMRAIEAEIVGRLGGEANLKLHERRSVISLSNFYGIEIKSFAAEIARLALLIAEFQADCIYLSQQEARAMVLPLHKTGEIHVGNALRLDWLEVCPPVTNAGATEHDLAGSTGRLALVENGLGDSADTQTYICGNPPYLGSTWQTEEHKDDLKRIFAHHISGWRSLDYVAGWFMKAAEYSSVCPGASAFVSTNSISQGQIVPLLWPLIFKAGREIAFAFTSFKWSNLASHNAGVTVIIIGMGPRSSRPKRLYTADEDGSIGVRVVEHINAYLTPGANVIIQKLMAPTDERSPMLWGNKPADGGNLILSTQEVRELLAFSPDASRFIRPFLGAEEVINGIQRFALWIRDEDVDDACSIPFIRGRLEKVRAMRSASNKAPTRALADYPHRYAELRQRGDEKIIVIPGISSENRPYLPCGVLQKGVILSNKNYALFNAPLWNMALIASRLHWVWIGTVCIRLEMRFSYSNTLGWNTFPVPKLTDLNKADLTRCAENILLAREAHFPATIADLYNQDAMPAELRGAHEANDEVLERIYIGRRFRNDTERLEKLFDLYAKMTAKQPSAEVGEAAG